MDFEMCCNFFSLAVELSKTVNVVRWNSQVCIIGYVSVKNKKKKQIEYNVIIYVKQKIYISLANILSYVKYGQGNWLSGWKGYQIIHFMWHPMCVPL